MKDRYTGLSIYSQVLSISIFILHGVFDLITTIAAFRVADMYSIQRRVIEVNPFISTNIILLSVSMIGITFFVTVLYLELFRYATIKQNTTIKQILYISTVGFFLSGLYLVVSNIFTIHSMLSS